MTVARRYIPTSAGAGLRSGDVAPSISIHVLPSSDLAHCHLLSATLSSSSDRLAESGLSTCGCGLSMLAVPASSTSVTLTETLRVPPAASTVTRYTFLTDSSAPSAADCGSS